jgi:hypothetical protein
MHVKEKNSVILAIAWICVIKQAVKQRNNSCVGCLIFFCNSHLHILQTTKPGVFGK